LTGSRLGGERGKRALKSELVPGPDARVVDDATTVTVSQPSPANIILLQPFSAINITETLLEGEKLRARLQRQQLKATRHCA
jgi:hypothetical protein